MKELKQDYAIEVKELSLGYGKEIILKDITLEVEKESCLVVMGGSGCGKSTLLKSMVGLLEPLSGNVFHYGKKLWGHNEKKLFTMLRDIGVLFQGGALWSSMTLLENVSLPLHLSLIHI